MLSASSSELDGGVGGWRSVVVVDLGFTTLLTYQVISVTFYSEREKADKFGSETLILLCKIRKTLKGRKQTNKYGRGTERNSPKTDESVVQPSGERR